MARPRGRILPGDFGVFEPRKRNEPRRKQEDQPSPPRLEMKGRSAFKLERLINAKLVKAFRESPGRLYTADKGEVRASYRDWDPKLESSPQRTMHYVSADQKDHVPIHLMLSLNPDAWALSDFIQFAKRYIGTVPSVREFPGMPGFTKLDIPAKKVIVITNTRDTTGMQTPRGVHVIHILNLERLADHIPNADKERLAPALANVKAEFIKEIQAIAKD
jgi:hypothetical protein